MSPYGAFRTTGERCRPDMPIGPCPAYESELEGAFEVAQHCLELRGRLLERRRDALSLGFQVEIDVCFSAAHGDRDAVAPRPEGRGDAVSAALESPQHSAGSRGVQIFKRSAYRAFQGLAVRPGLLFVFRDQRLSLGFGQCP